LGSEKWPPRPAFTSQAGSSWGAGRLAAVITPCSRFSSSFSSSPTTRPRPGPGAGRADPDPIGPSFTSGTRPGRRITSAFLGHVGASRRPWSLIRSGRPRSGTAIAARPCPGDGRRSVFGGLIFLALIAFPNRIPLGFYGRALPLLDKGPDDAGAGSEPGPSESGSPPRALRTSSLQSFPYLFPPADRPYGNFLRQGRPSARTDAMDVPHALALVQTLSRGPSSPRSRPMIRASMIEARWTPTTCPGPAQAKGREPCRLVRPAPMCSVTQDCSRSWRWSSMGPRTSLFGRAFFHRGRPPPRRPCPGRGSCSSAAPRGR